MDEDIIHKNREKMHPIQDISGRLLGRMLIQNQHVNDTLKKEALLLSGVHRESDGMIMGYMLSSVPMLPGQASRTDTEVPEEVLDFIAANWSVYMVHEDCSRCKSLAREAARACIKYNRPQWTSVDDTHGAAVSTKG